MSKPLADLRLLIVVLLLAALLGACGSADGTPEAGAGDDTAEAAEGAGGGDSPPTSEEGEPSPGGAGEPSSDGDQPSDDEPAEAGDAQPDEPPRPDFSRLPGVTTATAFGPLGADGVQRWRNEFSRIRDVRIPSSIDGHRQPALWLPPSGGGDKPLLVVLHSWSNQYAQHIGIPYARWARRHGWGMIAPNFRGVNNKPQATGSNQAVQDVVDAIDFAIRRGGIDADRVFTVGFSGGGMMSLLMAGRHPGRIAGAVSWVPVHDLVDWYDYNASQVPRRDYANHIAASCRGNPTADEDARRRCRHRSPSGHLDRARRAGVPVFIGHGLSDTLVRPDHAVRAFNQLARPEHRVGRRSIARLAENRLPDHLRRIQARHHFTGGDPRVHFARRSGSATLVLFEGQHDMVYHPGLRWMLRVGWD